MVDPAAEVVARAERLYADLSLEAVRAWKARHPGRPAVGHLPVYVPRELIAAVGGLPVALRGGGDQIDIVRGDACFQSYLCHLPRSTMELGLGGQLDALDGVVFPSTCDVIRNLSGVWRLSFPGKLAYYLDLPQAFDEAGGAFYRLQLTELARALEPLGGRPLGDDALAEAIVRYDDNRRALAELAALRVEAPWLAPVDEAHLVARAGGLLPVDDHTALVDAYVGLARRRARRSEDRIRVIVVGAFCEAPPLGLLRTLERAGCYVVGDDLDLGARFLDGDVVPGADPLGALVHAYLFRARWSSVRHERVRDRGALLVDEVKTARADGVVFAAPSFCDPALLDQPPLMRALEEANVPFTLFKYTENGGQFQAVREQVGTFSDSIRLWGST